MEGRAVPQACHTQQHMECNLAPHGMLQSSETHSLSLDVFQVYFKVRKLLGEALELFRENFLTTQLQTLVIAWKRKSLFWGHSFRDGDRGQPNPLLWAQSEAEHHSRGEVTEKLLSS